MSQVFYYCATEIHNNVQQSHHLHSPFARGKIRALDTRIINQVFYNRATELHDHIQHFSHILSPCARVKLRALDSMILSQVFYHCATITMPNVTVIFYLTVLGKRLKPLILGL